MICIPRYDCIYVGAEKTASTSIYAWLRKHFHAYKLLGSKHNYEIKRAGRHTLWFVSCRNPFTRAVSMHAHANREIAEHGKVFPNFDGGDFDDWLDWQRWLRVNGFWRFQSMAASYQKVRISGVIAFERLPKSLKVLPFVRTTPRLPRLMVGTYREPPHELLTGAQIEAIQRLFAVDFREFGYSMNPKRMYEPPRRRFKRHVRKNALRTRQRRKRRNRYRRLRRRQREAEATITTGRTEAEGGSWPRG